MSRFGKEYKTFQGKYRAFIKHETAVWLEVPKEEADKTKQWVNQFNQGDPMRTFGFRLNMEELLGTDGTWVINKEMY